MDSNRESTKKRGKRGPYGRKQLEIEKLQEIPEKVFKEYEEEQLCLGIKTSPKCDDIAGDHSLHTALDREVSTKSAAGVVYEAELEEIESDTLGETCNRDPFQIQEEHEAFHLYFNDDDFHLLSTDNPNNSEYTLMDDTENFTISEGNEETEDLFFIPEEDSDTFESEYIDDNDSQPLFEGARVTTGAFMLLLALFTSKHKISGDGIQQLLPIISLVLPFEHNLRLNLQGYRNFFKNLRNPLQKHYYCPSCLGTIENPVVGVCSYSACKKEISGKLPYFLEIPVIEQIRSKFKQSGFFEQLQGRFKRNLGERYEDIYDGKLYLNQFMNDGLLSCQDNISFVFNTDGASVFKSNNTSIWPVFMVINELPYKIRMMRENMILAGLWFGRQKPSLSTFLKPLKETMMELWKGIEILCPERGSFICRGFLLACTADLPARSLLCNSVQYNGDFGCWKCHQKGKTANVGKGHTHVFPFCDHNPKGPLRTTKNVVENAQEIVKQKLVKKISCM